MLSFHAADAAVDDAAIRHAMMLIFILRYHDAAVIADADVFFHYAILRFHATAMMAAPRYHAFYAVISAADMRHAFAHFRRYAAAA